jgi:hypothetical protein
MLDLDMIVEQHAADRGSDRRIKNGTRRTDIDVW